MKSGRKRIIQVYFYQCSVEKRSLLLPSLTDRMETFEQSPTMICLGQDGAKMG